MIDNYTTCPGCVIKDSQINNLRDEIGRLRDKLKLLCSDVDPDRNIFPPNEEKSQYPGSGYD